MASRPGPPPVPGGTTTSGPFAASTIKGRGAIRLAISASPNCSSRPKTLRSIGSSQSRRAVAEIAADADGRDPRVERRGVEGDQSPFAPADHADLRVSRRLLPREPVDRREHLLHLVADQVAAQLERRPVEELAVGELRPAVARLDVAVDQHRHDHAGNRSRPAGGRTAIRARTPRRARRSARASGRRRGWRRRWPPPAGLFGLSSRPSPARRRRPANVRGKYCNSVQN